MFKFVLPLLLIFLCQQGQAQDRFIVAVLEYAGSSFDGAIERCPATIITDTDVLTTAACATPTNSSLNLAIQIRVSLEFGFASTTVSTLETFIHPNYTGDIHSNNVAVIRIDGIFNTTLYPPRALGSIPSTNTTCSLFGWGGAPDVPERVDVMLHTPEYCYANESQTYCSEHLPSQRACAASVGSPLLCSPQSVDGILLRTGCIEESDGRFLQPYHSISEFRDWIDTIDEDDEVDTDDPIVDAAFVNQISAMALLSAFVICLKNSV